MKGRGASLLTVLLLRMFFIGFVAVYGDSKGISRPNTDSQTVDLSETQKAPPTVKGDVEKKDIDKDGQSQQETTTNSLKDKGKNLSDGRDKPLEEPKASSGLSKGSLVGGSNKKKPHIIHPQISGCDPSNSCIDKKNNLVACLRVPGTDTQALSLVIQNKANISLDVKIIAPSFVNLEQSEMQINSKEDKEVKVYVNEGSAKDSMIILQAGGGDCSLDFRNIMSKSGGESETFTMSRYISTSTSYAVLCIFFAASVVICVGWLCIRFRPFLRREAGPTYQKLEVGLPVSTGGKKEAGGGGGDDGGWENGWDNGWDEEEVPMTPSGTISNPSLKGLASRKISKDGWKD